MVNGISGFPEENIALGHSQHVLAHASHDGMIYTALLARSTRRCWRRRLHLPGTLMAQRRRVAAAGAGAARKEDSR